MNIVLAVHHFPPRFHGGAEREALRCGRGFRRRGHRVRVVCVEHIDRGPADGVAWSDEEYDGVSVRRLSMDLRRAPDRFRWQYDNPWIQRHLREVLLGDAADVFLLFGGYLLTGSALVGAREAGVPSIVRLMDSYFLCPRITLLRSDGSLSMPPLDPRRCVRCLAEESRRWRIPGRVAPAVMQTFWNLRRARVARVEHRAAFLLAALETADSLLSPSQFLRNVYVGCGVDPRSIHFMRQGIELPEAAPEHPPTPPLRLGYLGQIAPMKGVDVLLRAVRALPGEPLEVKIYGDLSKAPDYAEELRAIAGDDPRVEMCGLYQSSGGLFDVMRRLHAVVVPSINYENSPNAILESYAYGRPVIASDLGGMSELVRHEESGLLFPAGDVLALRDRLQRLLREPSLLPVLRSGVPPMKSSDEEISEYEAWCERARSRHSPSAARV